MPEYKEHYVAFLDILGFKALLGNASCNEIYSIFDVLRTKTHGKLNENGVDIQAFDYIHYSILSDSVILYIESDIDDAFAALIHICNQLQASLANRESPILLRGGIAVGGLFYENDIVYGEGLTQAYLLESNLAKYPRIVFTGDTLSVGLNNTKYMFVDMEGIMRSYQEDEDALYYADYLRVVYWTTEDLIQYFDRLQAICNLHLNQGIESGLREKYLWLKRKVGDAIKYSLDVAEHYKEAEKMKASQHFEEYNRRFSMFPNRFYLELETSEG